MDKRATVSVDLDYFNKLVGIEKIFKKEAKSIALTEDFMGPVLFGETEVLDKLEELYDIEEIKGERERLLAEIDEKETEISKLENKVNYLMIAFLLVVFIISTFIFLSNI